MSRIKEVVLRIEVDTAKKGHNCRANKNHRIKMGDTRLKLRVDRNWVPYCSQCGELMLARGIGALENTLQRLRAIGPGDGDVMNPEICLSAHESLGSAVATEGAEPL